MNKHIVMAAAGVLLVAAAPAFAGEDITKALTEGKVNADARARYEFVDTDALQNGNATTARVRLGYTTGDFYGVSGVLEFEGVSGIFGEDYNDGVNGKTGKSLVADPETAEVNQAFLQYSMYDTTVRAGRQVLADWDNGRWVGSDNWRQNQTSYDGVLVQTKALKHVTGTYAYVAGINNNFGSETTTGRTESDSNLFNVSTDYLKFLTVSGYAYLVDSDEVLTAGSDTYGIRAAGDYAINNDWKALYAAEWANQQDAGHNAANYDLNYYAVEGGAGYKSATVKVGYEVSEGNGTSAVQTIAGNGHGFNGKADVIGTAGTAGSGLEDLYVKGHVEVGQVNQYVDGTMICAEYHDFQAEQSLAGGDDLGTEFDLEVSKDFGKHYNAGILFASFDSDNAAFADTDKVVVSVGAKF